MADWNGDGHLDYVHGRGERYGAQDLRPGFALNPGNGDGTLRESLVIEAPEDLVPGEMVSSVTRGGDFNRDGTPDVFVFAAGVGYLTFLGKGDGTFLPGWSYAPGGDAPCCGATFALGDLDGDGNEDLVTLSDVPNPSGPGNDVLNDADVSAWVLRGRGDGGFDDPVRFLDDTPFSGGNVGFAFEVKDVNGDRRGDLAIHWFRWLAVGSPESILDRVLVLFNLGEGLFSDPVVAYETLASEPNIGMVQVADLNADGHPDIALHEDRPGGQNGSTMEALLVVHGNGRGGFHAPVEIALRPMAGVLIRDLNGDGLADFTLTGGGWLSPGVEVVPGQGTPPFGRFHRGDSNDDGRADLADAVFTLSYLFATGRQPTCLEAANANDDPRLDISDGIHLLQALFLGGPRPPEPGLPPAPCGVDPAGSPADLGCDSYLNC